jgi:hypothetical protein
VVVPVREVVVPVRVLVDREVVLVPVVLREVVVVVVSSLPRPRFRPRFCRCDSTPSSLPCFASTTGVPDPGLTPPTAMKPPAISSARLPEIASCLSRPIRC